MISPNARMMTCPPRMNRSYGTTKSMMIRANDLDANMTVRTSDPACTKAFQGPLSQDADRPRLLVCSWHSIPCHASQSLQGHILLLVMQVLCAPSPSCWPCRAVPAPSLSAVQTYSRYMAHFTGKDYATVRKDMSRNRYFTAQQAVDYGLVDRVLAPDDRQTLELQVGS